MNINVCRLDGRRIRPPHPSGHPSYSGGEKLLIESVRFPDATADETADFSQLPVHATINPF